MDENGVEIPAPEGRKISSTSLYLSPFRAGNPAQPFYPGLVPGATFLRRSAARLLRYQELPCVFNRGGQGPPAIAFEVNGSKFLIGEFINAVVTFLLVGAAVYLFVVSNNKEVPGVPERRSADRRAALRLLHFINAERRERVGPLSFIK